MADPDALQDLHARLATPLEATPAPEAPAAWLAVDCCGTGLLLPLADAGEIFPFGAWVPVPHTRPWFLGVANLRGQLQGVVDLGRFLGLAATEPAPPEGGWLVGISQRLEAGAALRVDRLAGLRRADQLLPVPSNGAAARPAFAGALYHDPAGRLWQELRLDALVSDPHFLAVGAAA